MGYSGAWGKRIHEKKPEDEKSRVILPLSKDIHLEVPDYWSLISHSPHSSLKINVKVINQ